jgi:hypothetical protein
MFLLQRLIWLLAVIGAVWAVRRLLSGAGARPQAADRPRGVPDRAEGDMVRDRVCNTFLPRARALTVSGEDGEHYFCSERCREVHLQRRAG